MQIERARKNHITVYSNIYSAAKSARNGGPQCGGSCALAQSYGGPQVSCHHFSFEFDKTFFMQQNLIFGTQVIIFWP